MKQTVMVAIGVAVIVHGLDMALKCNNLYCNFSLVVRAINGEWMRHKNSAQTNYYL